MLVHVFLDKSLSHELSVFYVQFKPVGDEHYTEFRLRVRTPEIHREGDKLVINSSMETEPAQFSATRGQPMLTNRDAMCSQVSTQLDGFVCSDAYSFFKQFFLATLNSQSLVQGPSKSSLQDYPESLYFLIKTVAQAWRTAMLGDAKTFSYDIDAVVDQAMPALSGLQDRPAKPSSPASGVVLDW